MSAIDGCAKECESCRRPYAFDKCIVCVMEKLDIIRARRATGVRTLEPSWNHTWKNLSGAIGKHIEEATDV